MSATKPMPVCWPGSLARTHDMMTTSICLPWKLSTVSITTCKAVQGRMHCLGLAACLTIVAGGSKHCAASSCNSRRSFSTAIQCEQSDKAVHCKATVVSSAIVHVLPRLHKPTIELPGRQLLVSAAAYTAKNTVSKQAA